MTRCTDKMLGEMLHAWELGMLADDQASEFEVHLIECAACRSKLETLAQYIKQMQQSHEIKTAARRAAGGRLLSIPKYLLVAAILLIVALPAYWYGLRDDTPVVAQRMELLPTRSAGSDVIYLNRGGPVEISFVLGEDYSAGAADVVIVAFGGDTVLFLPEYTDLNGFGKGKVELPISAFHEGHYMLIVSPGSGDDSAAVVQYPFRVK